MNTLGKLIRTENREEWVLVSASFIAEALLNTLAVKERAVLAISGGNTPGMVFKELVSGNYLDNDQWERVCFCWVDERIVPDKHPDSNYWSALQVIGELPSSFYPMYHHAEGAALSAKKYSALISSLAGEDDLPAFDLIILGMGNDGHTASLFPGTKALQQTNELVVINEVPQLSATRMSLTFPVLRNARMILVLINGDEKKKLLMQLVCGNTGYPIEEALKGKNDKTWIYY
ncbi:6-phosphogluconolactonase [Hufsiella ginkgonis]|uniref:6-phosphogluconolactonase n=1 Tax=Hufsiella ginkgonis TaxID=2695274 RepID=A0A7K1Y2V5_9SPHI|nr:6-phosphogluconolactonase [Hufsiella ginkgonis]MXV17418.1 6-phosphogluconolactonase [Hufsiella ginkgonis]